MREHTVKHGTGQLIKIGNIGQAGTIAKITADAQILTERFNKSCSLVDQT